MKRSIFYALILTVVLAVAAFAGVLVSDTTIDQALEYIDDNCNEISVVSDSSTPTNLDNELGDVAVDAADFTLANGDTSGRKITVAAQDIVMDSSGTARHLVFHNSGTILAVTTITAISVDALATYTFGTFDLWEIRDTVAE